MNRVTKTLVAALALCGTVVFAAEPTDPNVIARQTLMKTIAGATKTLGEMAGGKVAFDAAAAEAAKATLTAAAADIPAKFEPRTTDPAEEAKPEVWTNWPDFLVKAKGLSDAATALDATTLEGVQGGMAGVGGACKACHSVYKM